MFVYYIYSFKDEKADDIFKKVGEELKDNRYRPFHFNKDNSPFYWKAVARSKIKKSNLVVFFMSKYYEKHKKNIDYELNLAKKYGKKIIYVSTDGTKPPSELEKYNGEYYPYEGKDVEGLMEHIRANLHEYHTSDHVFKGKKPENMTAEDKELLFKQYQEMFASTEALMDRRQNTSSFYISINTVLVAMIAAVVTLGLDTKLLCVFCIAISSFGIVMSKTWSDTLDSYDRINYSKFNVLESMEEYLPASMFAAEYKDTKNDFIKKSVPSYSQRERRIPLLFTILYSILAVMLSIVLILSIANVISL